MDFFFLSLVTFSSITIFFSLKIEFFEFHMCVLHKIISCLYYLTPQQEWKKNLKGSFHILQSIIILQTLRLQWLKHQLTELER